MKYIAYVLLAFLVPFLVSCASNHESADGFASSKRLADDDRDGVTNQFDLCKNTARTTTVDEDGCGVEQSLTASSDIFILLFKMDSVDLPKRERLRLQRTISAFTGEHVKSIEIEPHRMVEEIELNVDDRAEAVTAFLVSAGVDRALIEVVPIGTISEHYHSDSRTKNLLNSRVVIRVKH